MGWVCWISGGAGMGEPQLGLLSLPFPAQDDGEEVAKKVSRTISGISSAILAPPK